EAAKRVNMPFVTERWLGGMLTNFNTVRKSVKKMQSIEKMLNDGTLDSITKKERLTLTRDRDKMEKVLGGIAQISRIPAALFLVDIGHEHIALSEAKRLNITTFGMVDTNCDPNKVEFSIPANDDATKSIAIVTNYIVAAIAEGLAERQAEKDEETEDTDDSGTDAIKFDLGTDEDKERRRGSGPSGGKGRGAAGPQKRRVAGPGSGGNRPGGPGGRR
ncbi:MAG: 30S ribosomal protein S2, partial [Ginsengibacter sp.]